MMLDKFLNLKGTSIAFLIHKRYIPDPEQLNQQRFKCAAQMREPLYSRLSTPRKYRYSLPNRIEKSKSNGSTDLAERPVLVVG